MTRYIAEFLGTFTLVLIGCGAVTMSFGSVGAVGVAFAFGLALIAVAYSFGRVSGGHINPAVSVGMWLAGRLKTGDLIFYVAAQFAGAIVAAFLLMIIAPSGSALGANMFGENYGLWSALIFELFATCLFVLVILSVTDEDSDVGSLAGIVIGFTLVGLHFFGFDITGVSLNPARSFGPALFSGTGAAYAQILFFLIVPTLGGLLAGFIWKTGLLEGEFGEFTDSLKDLADKAKSATKRG